MKWFKHHTSWKDKELAILFDEGGLEGYGFGVLVIEKLAAHMDSENEPTISCSRKAWAYLLGMHHQSLRKGLALLERCPTFEVSMSGDTLTIGCPKLLKLKAESGGSQLLEVRVEVRVQSAILTVPANPQRAYVFGAEVRVEVSGSQQCVCLSIPLRGETSLSHPVGIEGRSPRSQEVGLLAGDLYKMVICAIG